MLNQVQAATAVRFTLQDHLDFLYTARPGRLAYRAKTLAEFEVWQAAFRRELLRLLGLENRSPLPGMAEKWQMIDRGTDVEEKDRLEVGEQVSAPMYVLVPKKTPPFKPILVFNGHDPSIQS